MIEKIKQERFIALLRNVPVEKIFPTVQALYEGGIRIFEVAFNPSKKDTIETVNKSMEIIKSIFGKEVSLCTGTTLYPEFVEAAYRAGAECIISPNADEDIIKLTKEYGMLSVPGAYTPTEIMRAYQLGADIVKIFPVLPDQISYLKNVISPLSHIPFIPTGGVRIDNAAEYIKCGAIALSAGTTIVPGESLEKGDYDMIRENARKFTDIVKGYNKI